MAPINEEKGDVKHRADSSLIKSVDVEFAAEKTNALTAGGPINVHNSATFVAGADLIGTNNIAYDTAASRISLGLRSHQQMFNTNQMKGTLNGMYRRKEMKRINNGNKKILQQLRDVKPSVGTYSDWKKHENRINLLKRNIAKE